MDAAASQSGGRKRLPPEDEASSSEGSTASRKRARVDEKASDVNQADERDEGEISDSKDGSSEEAVVQHRGWNGGVSSGLRTSFPSLKKGGTSKSLRQLTLDQFIQKDLETQPESDSKPDADVEPEAKTKADEHSNSKAEEVEVNGQLKSKDEVKVGNEPEARSWVLTDVEIEKLEMPDGYANYSKSRRARSWESRFEGWCIKLMSLNKDKEGIREASVLKEAWTGWLKKRKHINPLSLTAGLQACEKFQFDAEKLKEMVERALSSEPNSPTDSTSTSDPSTNDLETKNNNNIINNDISNDKNNSKQTKAMDNSKSVAKRAEATDFDQLTLPSIPSADELSKIKIDDDKAWEKLFLNWCEDLNQMNLMKVKAATLKDRNKLVDFYSQWVKSLELPKKCASAARRVAFDYAQHKGPNLATLFPYDAQQQKTELVVLQAPIVSQMAEQDAPMEDAKEEEHIVTLTEGELAYRDRYFPGLPPRAIFCVNCASTEHNSANCSEMTCSFCSLAHPAWRCPTRVRCTKCRQLGHEQAGCREKLMMADEEMECSVCASRDHLENTCSKLWSNFRPNPVKPNKVQALPVFCFRCGKEGHYGEDCGIAPPKEHGKSLKSVEIPSPWTMDNAQQYLDPSSSEVAIAFRADAPKPAGRSADDRPDLGKSIVPRTHIHFESDDDDEDDEFIQPSVQKKSKVVGSFGAINFAAEGRSNANDYSNNSGGRLPQGHGLPPKPPTPSYSSGPNPSLPSLGNHVPEPRRHATRNGGGGGGGRGGAGGRGRGGYSNRGRGGFSNR